MSLRPWTNLEEHSPQAHTFAKLRRTVRSSLKGISKWPDHFSSHFWCCKSGIWQLSGVRFQRIQSTHPLHLRADTMVLFFMILKPHLTYLILIFVGNTLWCVKCATHLCVSQGLFFFFFFKKNGQMCDWTVLILWTITTTLPTPWNNLGLFISFCFVTLPESWRLSRGHPSSLTQHVPLSGL